MLGACLIVRDEAAVIADRVATLTAFVDEVVVYDTGSNDDTADRARAAGAVVVRGDWQDDFSRARNAALAVSSAAWVLSVDADEVVLVDSRALRTTLAESSAVDAFGVQIDQVDDAMVAGDRTRAVKLFRREVAQWVGRVHETVCSVSGRPLRLALLAEQTLTLSHTGYADPEQAAEKGRRNARIGLLELHDLAADVSPGELARVLLDLGRSLVACGQLQGAADAVTTVRTLPLPRSDPRWLQATDVLARLALADEQYPEVCLLADQLREAGAGVQYCDWLVAQALAQLGQFERAARILGSVTEVIDPAGRRHDPARLSELKTLMAALPTGKAC